MVLKSLEDKNKQIKEQRRITRLRQVREQCNDIFRVQAKLHRERQQEDYLNKQEQQLRNQNPNKLRSQTVNRSRRTLAPVNRNLSPEPTAEEQDQLRQKREALIKKIQERGKTALQREQLNRHDRDENERERIRRKDKVRALEDIRSDVVASIKRMRLSDDENDNTFTQPVTIREPVSARNLPEFNLDRTLFLSEQSSSESIVGPNKCCHSPGKNRLHNRKTACYCKNLQNRKYGDSSQGETLRSERNLKTTGDNDLMIRDTKALELLSLLDRGVNLDDVVFDEFGEMTVLKHGEEPEKSTRRSGNEKVGSQRTYTMEQPQQPTSPSSTKKQSSRKTVTLRSPTQISSSDDEDAAETTARHRIIATKRGNAAWAKHLRQKNCAVAMKKLPDIKMRDQLNKMIASDTVHMNDQRRRDLSAKKQTAMDTAWKRLKNPFEAIKPSMVTVQDVGENELPFKWDTFTPNARVGFECPELTKLDALSSSRKLPSELSSSRGTVNVIPSSNDKKLLEKEIHLEENKLALMRIKLNLLGETDDTRSVHSERAKSRSPQKRHLSPSFGSTRCGNMCANGCECQKKMTSSPGSKHSKHSKHSKCSKHTETLMTSANKRQEIPDKNVPPTKDHAIQTSFNSPKNSSDQSVSTLTNSTSSVACFEIAVKDFRGKIKVSDRKMTVEACGVESQTNFFSKIVKQKNFEITLPESSKIVNDCKCDASDSLEIKKCICDKKSPKKIESVQKIPAEPIQIEVGTFKKPKCCAKHCKKKKVARVDQVGSDEVNQVQTWRDALNALNDPNRRNSFENLEKYIRLALNTPKSVFGNLSSVSDDVLTPSSSIVNIPSNHPDKPERIANELVPKHTTNKSIQVDSIDAVDVIHPKTTVAVQTSIAELHNTIKSTSFNPPHSSSEYEIESSSSRSRPESINQSTLYQNIPIVSDFEIQTRQNPPTNRATSSNLQNVPKLPTQSFQRPDVNERAEVPRPPFRHDSVATSIRPEREVQNVDYSVGRETEQRDELSRGVNWERESRRSDQMDIQDTLDSKVDRSDFQPAAFTLLDDRTMDTTGVSISDSQAWQRLMGRQQPTTQPPPIRQPPVTRQSQPIAQQPGDTSDDTVKKIFAGNFLEGEYYRTRRSQTAPSSTSSGREMSLSSSSSSSSISCSPILREVLQREFQKSKPHSSKVHSSTVRATSSQRRSPGAFESSTPVERLSNPALFNATPEFSSIEPLTVPDVHLSRERTDSKSSHS